MPDNDMNKYEWRITIGIQRHWVTTEEKDVYLRSIAQGMDLVPIRGGTIFLGKNPQEIIHCAALEESRKIEEYRKEGKYQCAFGSWHKDGATCYCNMEFIETDEGTMRLQEKTDKPLLEAGDTKQHKPLIQRQFQRVPMKSF